MNLPTLAAVLAVHDDIATVPTPGFRAWVSDGTQFLDPVIVSAVLDRTAIVHPPGHDDERRAVRLDAVFVAPQSIRWQARNRHELKELESRQRARASRRGKESQTPLPPDVLEARVAAWAPRRGKDPAAESQEPLPAVGVGHHILEGQ